MGNTLVTISAPSLHRRDLSQLGPHRLAIARPPAIEARDGLRQLIGSIMAVEKLGRRFVGTTFASDVEVEIRSTLAARRRVVPSVGQPGEKDTHSTTFATRAILSAIGLLFRPRRVAFRRSTGGGPTPTQERVRVDSRRSERHPQIQPIQPSMPRWIIRWNLLALPPLSCLGYAFETSRQART
jgi:hypothetical protein